jgi:hypothetical protein
MAGTIGPGAGAPRTGDVARHVIAFALLAATFVALLWVPSYAHLTPTLGGIPFFYWYSVLWLVINAVCQVIAYHLVTRHNIGRRP